MSNSRCVWFLGILVEVIFCLQIKPARWRIVKFLPQMGMLAKPVAALSVVKYLPQYLECKAVVDEQAVEPELLF